MIIKKYKKYFFITYLILRNYRGCSGIPFFKQKKIPGIPGNKSFFVRVLFDLAYNLHYLVGEFAHELFLRVGTSLYLP